MSENCSSWEYIRFTYQLYLHTVYVMQKSGKIGIQHKSAVFL